MKLNNNKKSRRTAHRNVRRRVKHRVSRNAPTTSANSRASSTTRSSRKRTLAQPSVPLRVLQLLQGRGLLKVVDFLPAGPQESIRTKHPQLLYESKLYKILQGGSEWLLLYLNS